MVTFEPVQLPVDVALARMKSTASILLAETVFTESSSISLGVRQQSEKITTHTVNLVRTVIRNKYGPSGSTISTLVWVVKVTEQACCLMFPTERRESVMNDPVIQSLFTQELKCSAIGPKFDFTSDFVTTVPRKAE